MISSSIFPKVVSYIHREIGETSMVSRFLIGNSKREGEEFLLEMLFAYFSLFRREMRIGELKK